MSRHATLVATPKGEARRDERRESIYFKELMKNPPAVFLSGARQREGLTQMELAERTGIPRRHISEMENGKRPIGKLSARKLAEALNIDPRRLLSV